MANSPSGESMTDRLVRVLATFSDDRPSQTAAQIGRRADLPSSTAHRIVEDLVESGLLERDGRGRVRLGMRLWELAHRGSRALRLREAALPFMEQVQARIREHTQLAVLEDGEALFLERLSDPDAGLNVARIAGRLPLHASSSGLVLLAYAPRSVFEAVVDAGLERLTPETIVDPFQLESLLAQIRSRGFAIAHGSVSQVSTGVAVPVKDRGEAVAALSVVLPRADVRAKRAVDVLTAAAHGIAAALARPAGDPPLMGT